MPFPPEILDRLRETEEVDIETQRAPGAPVHRTIIWVMVDDGDRVLIRSVRGIRGRWYREVIANPNCTLSVGDVDVPVRAEPATDADRVAAASAQLAVKYAGDPSLGSMLRADVLETTLELLPR
jgi:hypothetical protein